MPNSAGYFDIARPGPSGVSCGTPKTFRPSIAERLPAIGQCVDVHVLMSDGKLIKIPLGRVDAIYQPVELA